MNDIIGKYGSLYYILYMNRKLDAKEESTLALLVLLLLASFVAVAVSYFEFPNLDGIGGFEPKIYILASIYLVLFPFFYFIEFRSKLPPEENTIIIGFIVGGIAAFIAYLIGFDEHDKVRITFRSDPFFFLILLSIIAMLAGFITIIVTFIYRYIKSRDAEFPGLDTYLKLTPQSHFGKSHKNLVSNKLQDGSIRKNIPLDDQHFYFLFLLGLERKSSPDMRWIPSKEPIPKKHLKTLQQSLNKKNPIGFKWVEEEDDGSKSRVKGEINKKLGDIIELKDGFYTLDTNLFGSNHILLPDQ